MSAAEHNGWWYRATLEQRLAQIDAGLELGMTAGQVAMNCRCYDDQSFTRAAAALVATCAARHGRPFPRESDTTDRKRRKNGGHTFIDGKVVSRPRARLEHAKEAYLAGEPVDMWAVE